MEQLNQVLSSTGKAAQPAEVEETSGNENSPLLTKLRQNFKFYGTICLIFGGTFTFWFYKTGIGFNSLAFTVIMVVLLIFASRRLKLPIQKETKAYYLVAILLSLSNMLTASEKLHFLNTVGILLLLDVSLVRQYAVSKHLEFQDYIIRLFKLPFRSIASVALPFIDLNKFLKRNRLLKNDKVRNVLIGTVLAIPLLVLIGALLSSADQLFGKLTKDFSDLFLSSDPLFIIVMTLFGALACYSILCGAVKNAVSTKVREKADPGIAITAATLLLIIYVLFCTIQVIYLFAGGILELPKEYTYSQYARRGFFELLAVTCINLVLILVCMNTFRENKALKVILTSISGCTFIMIASAAYRMVLYIGAYHLTFLRLFVLLFLLIDALVLAGVVAALYQNKFPLFGYSVAVVSICYLLFSFSKPDYLIASYFLNNTEELEMEDVLFLSNELSFDAAPAVIPRFHEIESYIPNFYNKTETEQWLQSRKFVNNLIEEYFYRIVYCDYNKDIREFNLSYYYADMKAEQSLVE